MPIPDFDGETFVAFMDISGFNEMMKEDRLAVKAIDRLYSNGYQVLQDNQNINGLFVSDCGVLFVRNHGNNECRHQLEDLLNALEELNKRLLRDDIMLTTSIAFGRFSYHQRIEFEGIEKNPVYGHAYASAFLDNEVGKPRIQPGQCRIVKKGLCDLDFSSFHRMKERSSHWYFYWMVSTQEEIGEFEKQYTDAYRLKYSGMLKALKGAANGRSNPGNTSYLPLGNNRGE